MTAKFRIAFVTPTDPSLGDSGGTQVSKSKLESLASLGQVDIYILGGLSSDNLRKAFSVHTGGALRRRNATSLVKSYLAGLPLSVWRNAAPDFVKLINDHSAIKYDLVFIDHWLMWPAASNLCGPKILHLHNAEHLLFARAKAGKNFPLKVILEIEAQRTAAYLKKISHEADLVHCLSPADAFELAKIGVPLDKLKVFLPPVPDPGRAYGSFSKRLLFAGTMSWLPNLEGLQWFYSEVAPLLEGEEISLTLLGGRPPESININGQLNTQCPGRVPSVEPYYEESAVFIAPLLTGSGIKMKIVNALMHGLPVVTTPVGIEGFPDGWETCIRVGTTPDEFASHIRALTSDATAWVSDASAARRYALLHFSHSTFAPSLHDLLVKKP